MEKRITVFTPTYNRGRLLHRLYESLLRQTNRNFKWLVIDDGSTDDTRKIVNDWIAEGKIEIEYIYKKNGGLHTGYNKAIEIIDTELSMCIDSDDWLTDNAIEMILKYWDKNKNDRYAGLIGLDIDNHSHLIGDYLPNEKSVNPVMLLAKKCKGDKKYVVRSECYKKVAPMPSFENEKNFNPHYLILKLCKDYEFLILNKPLCVVDYQDDGMSANIFKQYLNSPNSFAELRRAIMELNIPFDYLLKTVVHYISSCIIAGQKDIISKSPRKLLTSLAFPAGYLLSKYIRKNANKVLRVS